MKVLQINATYGRGSTGNIAKDLHKYLKQEGHESYVFWATACSNLDNDPNVKRIGSLIDHKLHAVLRRFSFSQGFHSRLATKRFCKQLTEIRPDVIHLHNLHSNYIHLPTLYKCLQKNNIPTLVTLHDCWFFTGYCTYPQAYQCKEWKNGCKSCPAISKYSPKWAEKHFLKKENITKIPYLAVNGVSKWTEQDANESFLRFAKIKTHIYNWVDLSQYRTKATRAEVCQKYGIDASKKIILGVAQAWSVHDTKGGKAFCKILEALGDKVEVILAGGNNGMPILEGLHCIGYTSNKQDLVDLYAAADLFVNPSRFETFGLVTVEAMACGTPVVAYDNTGSAELVIDDCGKLVDDGNLDKLIETISEFIEEDLESYRDKCISYARENFSKEMQIKKYIELYRKISGKSFSTNKEH